jgi:hypothetical protein
MSTSVSNFLKTHNIDPRTGIRSHFSSAALSRGLLALINAQTGPTTPSAMAVSLLLEPIGTQPFNVIVDFSGTIVSPTGATGRTSFAISVPAEVSPGPPQGIGQLISDLRRGTWTVTAAARGVTAPLTCQALVPGSAIFNFTGGQSRCGS